MFAGANHGRIDATYVPQRMYFRYRDIDSAAPATFEFIINARARALIRRSAYRGASDESRLKKKKEKEGRKEVRNERVEGGNTRADIKFDNFIGPLIDIVVSYIPRAKTAEALRASARVRARIH